MGNTNIELEIRHAMCFKKLKYRVMWKQNNKVNLL